MSTGALNKINSEFFRYFLSALIALAADYILFIALTELAKINYLLSNVISYSLGLITIYLLSTHWAFERRRYQNRTIEFFTFTAIGICGLIVNNIAIWAITEQLGIHYYISKPISTTLSFLFNYTLRKFILFKPQNDKK